MELAVVLLLITVGFICFGLWNALQIQRQIKAYERSCKLLIPYSLSKVHKWGE